MSAEVFRFTTIRPPQGADADKILSLVDCQEGKLRSEFQQNLLSAKERRSRGYNARGEMVRLAKEFADSEPFKRLIHDLRLLEPAFNGTSAGLAQLSEWAEDGNAQGIREKAKEAFGKNIDDVIKSKDYKTTKELAADCLIAVVIVPKGRTQERELLVLAVRMCGLLELLLDSSIKGKDAIKKAMQKSVLLPEDIFPLPPIPSLLLTQPPPKTPPTIDLENTRKMLEEVKEAINELKSLQTSDFVTEDAKVRFQPRGSGKARIPVLSQKAATLELNIKTVKPWIVSSKAVDRLSIKTRKTLEAVGLLQKGISSQFSLIAAEDKLYKESMQLGKILFAPEIHQMVRVGSSHIPMSNLSESQTAISPEMPTGFESRIARPVGIADLRLVRQKLIGYTAVEIADIENVLHGEVKKRTHTRKEKTEESVLLETERTQESEEDLQTSDRFELQKEASKTLQQDLSLQAGLHVSAQYGPYVQVSVGLDVGYKTSKQESNRTATTFSHDVVERSVNKINERTKEERIRRITQEIEEQNIHELKAENDHVVGIYFWVNKVYKAQIVSYGLRTMFEFFIPEPAMFLLNTLIKSPEDGKPQPPVWEGRPLKPQDIDETNYQKWVAEYNATGVEPPPPATQLVTETLKQVAGGGSPIYEAQKIPIPAGYKAKKGLLMINEFGILGNFYLITTVADKTVAKWYGNWADYKQIPWYVDLSGNETDAIPVTIYGENVGGYTIAIEIKCERDDNDSVYKLWQIKTYEAIYMAFLKQNSDYEEKLARQGVVISGQNPALNRETEKIELKKHAISILLNEKGLELDFGSIRLNENGPEIEFQKAESDSDYITFFEQVFEWENMAYNFYPYYWGRKGNWELMLGKIKDPDPLYESFLRAGGARVLVPVRPGFEGMITDYMLTGNIWSGRGRPVIGNQGWVDVNTEILEGLGADVGGEVAVDENTGKPLEWEVTIPTSLVYLKNEQTKLPYT